MEEIKSQYQFNEYYLIVGDQEIHRNSYWTYTGQQLIQDYLNYVQKSVGNAFNTRYYLLSFTASNGYTKISSWTRSMDYLAEDQTQNRTNRRGLEILSPVHTVTSYLVEEGYNDTEDHRYILH